MEQVNMNTLMFENQDLQEKVEKMNKTIKKNREAIDSYIKHSINQDLLIDQLHIDLRQARERINRLESIVFTLEQGNMKMGTQLEKQYKDRIKASKENAKD